MLNVKKSFKSIPNGINYCNIVTRIDPSRIVQLLANNCTNTKHTNLLHALSLGCTHYGVVSFSCIPYRIYGSCSPLKSYLCTSCLTDGLSRRLFLFSYINLCAHMLSRQFYTHTHTHTHMYATHPCSIPINQTTCCR